MSHIGLVHALSQQQGLACQLRFLGQQVQQQMPEVERFSVALYQSETHKVRSFFTTSPEDQALTAYEFNLQQTWSLQKIAHSRQPRVIDDLADWLPPRYSGRVNPHTARLYQQGWRSSFTLPLIVADQLLGFVFFNSRQTQVFQGERLGQLELYGQLIAQLIFQDHAGIRTLTAAVRSMLALCAGRDPETGEHLERMALYTQLIASHLSPHWTFSDRQIQHLYLFAPLHDLGKIAISDRILLKPGRLTPSEFAQMQQHPLLGAELLDKVIEQHGLTQLPDVHLLRNLVLYHHEKMDGTGYPFGLQGEKIPIEARIVAVADVYDALTSERPYKKAWSQDQALTELSRLAGSHLDADCVEVMLNQQQELAIIRDQLCSDVVESG